MFKYLSSYTIEDLKDPEALDKLKSVFASAGNLMGSLIVSYLKAGGPPEHVGVLFKDVPAAVIHTLLSLPPNEDTLINAEKVAEERAMATYLHNLKKEDFPGNC